MAGVPGILNLKIIFQIPHCIEGHEPSIQRQFLQNSSMFEEVSSGNWLSTVKSETTLPMLC